jgi:hypothetical protein
MAIHTPTHREIRILRHLLHRFDLAVTLLTIHSTLDVSRVIELHVIGQHVDAHPLDRFTFLIGFTDLRNLRAIRLDLNVTVHAGAQGWNIGVAGPLDLVVAILTRNLQLPGMQRVIIRNGLRWRVAFVVPNTSKWPIARDQL